MCKKNFSLAPKKEEYTLVSNFVSEKKSLQKPCFLYENCS